MPEKPPSSRERPSIPLFAQAAGKRAAVATSARRTSRPMPSFSAASNFSFLRGASHPEELAATAAVLGLAGFAIADRNTLAGIVRGHLAAKTDRRPLCRRLPARLPRRHARHRRVADRPRRLWQALPAAHHRQSPHQEGRVPSRPRRPPGMGEGMEMAVLPGARVTLPPQGGSGGKETAAAPTLSPEGEGVASTCEGAGEGEVSIRVAANRRLPSPVGSADHPPPQGGGLANRRPCWSERSPLSPKPSPATCGSAPTCLYHGDDRRRLAASRRTRGALRSSACWRSATCSITRRSGESCRTCSPASASTGRWRLPGGCSRRMPSGT